MNFQETIVALNKLASPVIDPDIMEVVAKSHCVNADQLNTVFEHAMNVQMLRNSKAKVPPVNGPLPSNVQLKKHKT